MEVRFFHKEETKLLQEAIATTWGKGHILSRDTQLLEYMFYTNPRRKLVTSDNELSFLGLWFQGEVVGLLGTIPLLANFKGKRKLGFALTNWVVNEEHRRSVNALDLITQIQSFNPALILSLGINPEVAKLYRLMKWNVADDVPRWVGIPNNKAIKEYLYGGADVNTPLDYMEELHPPRCRDQSYQIKDQELDQEKWDKYYFDSFAKISVGFARDYAFLKWRYIDHPYFDYKVFACTNSTGDYVGLAVFRIEPIENGRIGRIVEFIAVDEHASVALANAIAEYDHSVLFWDFYSSSPLTAWGLELIGFHKIPSWMANKLVIPTRFQPLDYKVTNLMASVYLPEQSARSLSAFDMASLYITKGDSDQDRPN